jgi:hypothetical protein
MNVPLFDSFTADNTGIQIEIWKGRLRRHISGTGWGYFSVSWTNPRHPRTEESLRAGNQKLGLNFLSSRPAKFADRDYQCYEYQSRPSFSSEPWTDIWCLNSDPAALVPRFNGTADAVPDFYRLLASAKILSH